MRSQSNPYGAVTGHLVPVMRACIALALVTAACTAPAPSSPPLGAQSAATQSSQTPTAPVVTGTTEGIKGTLLWQAAIDSAGSGVQLNQPPCNGPGGCDVRLRQGEIEIAILKASSYTGLAFKGLDLAADAPPRFVAEIDLTFRPESELLFEWSIGNLHVRLDSLMEDLDAGFVRSGINYPGLDVFAPQVAVPGLDSGRPTTITVQVDAPRLTFYRDGRLLADSTDSTQTRVSGPMAIFVQSRVDGRGGVATVTGARVYAAR